MEKSTADILVVGGGAGGVSAAIQASCYGIKTILATEFSWLGGMLTSAGVAAPDGNELASLQTGLWGAYLRKLKKRQHKGLDNGWVSLFTYKPIYGAEIFAEWVAEIPNLQWIKNCKPRSVLKQNNRVLGVRFDDLLVEAKITIDATELGDLLALAEISYRWGWESFAEFNEPSLSIDNKQPAIDFQLSNLMEKYPVQAPTWVFVLQDYGEKNRTAIASETANSATESKFIGAWNNYGAEKFLNYGRLSDNLYMVNWPLAGNDYGVNLNRLIASETEFEDYLTEAYNHSYDFAHYIRAQLGNNYGFADIFPQQINSLIPNLDPAFALHPYYRESRRLRGKTTVIERDILPVADGCVASLPINKKGEVTAIAVGNYANDHHYPGIDFKLTTKSILWGGRWTGTPFTVPFDALIPETIDGLLVAEKNISVSHMANGSTRLQPIVMNIGQAAGAAAALCIQNDCQPRELAVRKIQEALITDRFAPAAVIPLFNLVPDSSQWLYWQRYYLEHPEQYPTDGNCPDNFDNSSNINSGIYCRGTFIKSEEQNYSIRLNEPLAYKDRTWQLITVEPLANRQLLDWQSGALIKLLGRFNCSGNWLLVEKIID